MTSDTPHLIRVLRLRPKLMVGKDVEAVRRASIRFLRDDALWARFRDMPVPQRRTAGPGFDRLIRRVQRQAQLPVDGAAGPAVDRVLRKWRAYDWPADRLLAEYAASVVKVCYPHPAGVTSTICQGPHVTAGLAGNWAMDFCAPGGTPVLAVVDAEIVKLSGSPPDAGADHDVGIFGWNVHYRTPDGYRWFSTHYGSLSCYVGQKLTVGTRVGRVGSWPGEPSRSHTHLGVTSPKGWLDAQRWIEKVAHAPRLPGGAA